MNITAKAAAEALYPRLHPSSIYTMTRSQLRELLLLLPGGELWHNGRAFTPVSVVKHNLNRKEKTLRTEATMGERVSLRFFPAGT